MEQEKLKAFSLSVFRSLCTKVRGHVTTWPDENEDAVTVRIRKGPVNFEVKLRFLASFVEAKERLASEDTDVIADCAETCAKEIVKRYKAEVLTHYVK